MKVAVILSGCGVRDGSEIHEATSALICLAQRGHNVECFAPQKPQTQVVNHFSGKPQADSRDILAESGRIARGKIRPLAEAKAENIDAILLPGGFGAALNLCDFALKGADCTVEPSLKKLLLDAHQNHKAMGFMCISPVIAAKLFGSHAVELTIGEDAQTSQTIEKMGAKHIVCSATQVHIDKKHKIASVPAYMMTESIAECFQAANALVAALESLQ